eukprot:TRINITY_DN41668_c0_g1_i1.p1 TRINITY_DN41668_c0_g1~~TRINITY_DN41668_c0_g1_i1.p1  ORF type:complete len:483 (-),score=81.38 TRINITY_DN41668_c0_g1_i1:165-1613(-)
MKNDVKSTEAHHRISARLAAASLALVGNDEKAIRRASLISSSKISSETVQKSAELAEAEVEAEPRCLSEEDSAKVGASKAISILSKMERDGTCEVEAESIYGAAVAMPQIARSAGWPGTLFALVIRIYFFTLLNILLQGFLLSMIGEEQLTWYPFAGQMHLCDFGASIVDCPNAPNCKGPLGTEYSAPRLYDYNIWSTRIYVRDSLKAIFPHKAKEFDEKVDPGEYGMENYNCRLACVFLFMLYVVDDLVGTVNLLRTLWLLPTKAESWIRYEIPEWADKEDIKTLQDAGELDFIKFGVAGLPLHWKIINFVILVIPKFALWLALVRSGVHYLMETAGIVDDIVNAMALTFVLEVDEMVFHRFSTVLTKHIMSSMEDWPNYNLEEDDAETEEEALDRFTRSELGTNRWRGLLLILPHRFLTVLTLQFVFLWDYYRTNCIQLEDGSWVSKTMHLPADLTYNPLKLMFGIEGTTLEDAFWTMPD